MSHWIPYKNGLEPRFSSLPEGCNAFGSRASKQKVDQWITVWKKAAKNLTFLLVLAGTKTSEVDGISAAGSTPYLRRYTALADAEFLLKGPLSSPKWPLPLLPAGFSPALISYVGKKLLNLEPLILSAGLFNSPDFPCISMEPSHFGPAECLINGKAMELHRVRDLWRKGYLRGKAIKKPLLITECVPGGTTTAQAVMTGLGMDVAPLMGSSVRNPPLETKEKIVAQGLKAADLGGNPSPEELIAAVGDPFQPIAVGLLLGAREAGQHVLLGGGSQMLAVLALALRSVEIKNRSDFLEGVSIATTKWLATSSNLSSEDINSSFLQLIRLLEQNFNVSTLCFSSGLSFERSSKHVLRDYENGYIKEGVGAGAVSLLAQVNGVDMNDLVDCCERTIDLFYRLLNP